MDGEVLCKLLAIRDVHCFLLGKDPEPAFQTFSKSLLLFINSLPIALHDPSHHQDPLKTEGSLKSSLILVAEKNFSRQSDRSPSHHL